ncbi:MAG: CapA family protein [Verrucomicrobia subdivision 3 bacterium]|nr:CapA family protein [Limisphaerales bacterium]
MNGVTFLGDIWLPQPVKSAVNFDEPIVFNLEGPITGCTSPAHQKICLRMERNCIETTFRTAPLAVCLANNHIMDYGLAGYLDTLATLKAAGIRHFGAGTLAENCNNPLVLPVGDTLVGLLGYVCPTTDPVFAEDVRPGVRPITLSRIEMDIQTARQQGARRVVVNLHWGAEGVGVPRPVDVELAHRILAAGADTIIGHHSHCIQSYELWDSKCVCYGLGNCIFPSEWVLRPAPAGFTRFRLRIPAASGFSMRVRLDLESGTAAPSILRFDGGELKTVKRSVTRFLLPSMSPEAYARHYHRRAHGDLLRFDLGCFLAQPRLPKLATCFDVLHRLLKGIGVS